MVDQQLIYPKDEDAMLAYRERVISKSLNDKEMQQLLIQECKDDILFFVNVFCWTYNPRLDDANLFFITFPFQDMTLQQMVAAVRNRNDVFIEKSRDMGASWMTAALCVWGFLFHDWACLYGSYKEDYVDQQGNLDSFFERCRYIIGKLPPYLLPEDLLSKYTSISSQSKRCSIAGDVGKNFGTGGRRKVVIMDEFQAWQHDSTAFRKTADVTDCRIIVGTPEGKGNVYGKIMTKHKDYKHIQGDFIRLHWTLHPNKTQEWYEEEKKKRTKLDIAKELDISYENSIDGAVYPTFNDLATFGDFDLQQGLPLYTSWDFGRDMVSIIWVQHCFKTGNNYIIDSFQKSMVNEPITIEWYSALVTGEPTQGCSYNESELEVIERHRAWKGLYADHFGDPYNSESKSGVTLSSFASKLRQYGIHIRTKRGTKLQERITKTYLGLKSLFIHEERNFDFINAITQSRYPQRSENSQQTTEAVKPVHDVNSHFRTALEYYMDNEPVKAPGATSNEVKAQDDYLRSLRSGGTV